MRCSLEANCEASAEDVQEQDRRALCDAQLHSPSFGCSEKEEGSDDLVVCPKGLGCSSKKLDPAANITPERDAKTSTTERDAITTMHDKDDAKATNDANDKAGGGESQTKTSPSPQSESHLSGSEESDSDLGVLLNALPLKEPVNKPRKPKSNNKNGDLSARQSKKGVPSAVKEGGPKRAAAVHEESNKISLEQSDGVMDHNEEHIDGHDGHSTNCEAPSNKKRKMGEDKQNDEDETEDEDDQLKICELPSNKNHKKREDEENDEGETVDEDCQSTTCESTSNQKRKNGEDEENDEDETLDEDETVDEDDQSTTCESTSNQKRKKGEDNENDEDETLDDQSTTNESPSNEKRKKGEDNENDEDETEDEPDADSQKGDDEENEGSQNGDDEKNNDHQKGEEDEDETTAPALGTDTEKVAGKKRGLRSGTRLSISKTTQDWYLCCKKFRELSRLNPKIKKKWFLESKESGAKFTGSLSEQQSLIRYLRKYDEGWRHEDGGKSTSEVKAYSANEQPFSPAEGKKRGIKEGPRVGSDKTPNDWYLCCKKFRELSRDDPKLKKKRFLESKDSGDKFTGSVSEQQSMIRYLRRFDAGLLKPTAAPKPNRERTPTPPKPNRERSFQDIEDKLMEYLDLRVSAFKRTRCAASWGDLQKKSLEFARALGHENFQASYDWLNETLDSYVKKDQLPADPDVDAEVQEAVGKKVYNKDSKKTEGKYPKPSLKGDMGVVGNEEKRHGSRNIT